MFSVAGSLIYSISALSNRLMNCSNRSYRLLLPVICIKRVNLVLQDKQSMHSDLSGSSDNLSENSKVRFTYRIIHMERERIMISPALQLLVLYNGPLTVGVMN